MKYELNIERTSAQNLSNYDATSGVVFSVRSKCDITCQSLWLGVNNFQQEKNVNTDCYFNHSHTKSWYNSER